MTRVQVSPQSNAPDAVDKALNVVDKVGGCINLVRNGCIWLVANLFFLAFAAWGGFHAYSSWQLVNEGGSAIGTVVRLEESESNEGGTVYSPVVEFTANGQTHSFESGNASDPPDYEVGDEVKVLYDPAAPNEARIESFAELWLMPILLIPAMLLGMLIVNGVFGWLAIRGRLHTEDIE